MKKHFLSLPYMALMSSLILFSLSSCEKLLPESLPFDLPEASSSFKVPATDFTGDTSIAANNLYVNLDSALTANGVDNYTVSTVKATSALLETNTDGANFDGFKTLEVYLKTDSLKEVKIASAENIENGLQSLPLKIADVNLAKYLTKPASLRVAGNIDDTIRTEMDVKVRVKLNMIATKK